MGQTYRFGEFEVDYRLFQIRRRGKLVPVERRVFDLIAYLLANSDRVVSKEELFERIWEGRVVSSGSLTVAIAAARRALCDSSANPQIIVTHRGRGYRFRLEECSESVVATGAIVGNRDQFVGRDGELQSLRALLNSADAARPSFASIVGEPGIGKSRLIEEFAEVARESGAQAFVGRCREENGAPPFWPWIQIVREVCNQECNQHVCMQLAREAPEIASAVPALRTFAQSVDDRLPPANARFRLFDGFSRFITQICLDRTLVMLLDDIHRADIDSLMLLEFLLDALRSARLLIVVAHRPGDLLRSRERFGILSRAIRKVSGMNIPLGGLSTPEISRLVRVLGGWSPTIEQVRAFEELTAGNPFFLGQLATILGQEGEDVEQAVVHLPATARDAIAQHLQGIRAETLDLLRTASVIGREFEAWILARAHGERIVDTAASLAEAAELGVISVVSGGRESYRFAHALVRDVLYQALPSEERARLHGAVGEALDHHSVSRTARVEELAFHYAEAAVLGNVDRAVEACGAAAEQARKAVAYGEAVGHYQRALEVLETWRPHDERRICSLLLALGANQVRTGEREGAKRSFDRAARIAEANRAPHLIAEAALGVASGFFSVEAGVDDELLIGLLRRAHAQLGEDQPSLRALVLARLGMALFWTDSTGECAELSREAWEIARSIDDGELRLHVLMARWLAEWTPYGVEERCAIAEEAIALAQVTGDKEVLAVALLFGLPGLFEKGRIDHFDQRAQEFRLLAENIRQPQALWYSGLIKAARDLHSGRFARAEEGALAYFEIGRRIGDANAFHSRMAQGLVHAAERGDGDAILEISDEARRRYPIFVGWRASRCWALARTGQWKAAEAALNELVSMGLSSLPRKLDWPTALAVLSEAAFLLKRGDVAEELYELLLPLRGKLLVLGFCVMSWGPVSRYLGLLSETIGRSTEASDWYEQAIEEARCSQGDPWAAHAAFGLYRVRMAMGLGGSATNEMALAALGTARRLCMRHLEETLSRTIEGV